MAIKNVMVSYCKPLKRTHHLVKMAYKLEHAVQDHQDTLQETLMDWSKDDHDIYIVSDEGHKIFTQKILLYFYSHTLGTILDSLPPSTSTPGISVSASSNSISNLLKLLTTGQAASNNKDTLVNVKEAAKALGISLGNCLMEGKRIPGQTTIIRKLPVKTGPTVSASPTNLSVFRSRESGIGGIAKWNTVISAKNKITQVPTEDNAKGAISEETKVDDEETNNSNEQKLRCEVCSKLFSGKRNLRRHKFRKHQTSSKVAKSEPVAVKVKLEKKEDCVSQFPCTECDREFDSEQKLYKHALQHTNKFSCDQCDKSFSNSGILRNHKNIHLDEKPFKCDICDKGFTQLGNLKTHKIRYHAEENSAETANPSEVSDADDTDVIVHLTENVSAGDNCGYCDEQFDDASELNSHMVLMHSIQEMIESSD